MSADVISSDEELENIVFGTKLKRNYTTVEESKEEDLTLCDYQIDTGIDEDVTYGTKTSKKAKYNDGALWVDSDDEEMKVNVLDIKHFQKPKNNKDNTVLPSNMYINRLRARFEECNSKPSWADKEEYESDEKRELFLSSVNQLAAAKNNDQLGLIHLKDANRTIASSKSLTSVNFHPNSTVLMTAGLSKRIDLFKINAKKNSHIQSLIIEKFPVSCCRFSIPSASSGANEIVATSRRPYFYVHDLEKNTGSCDYRIRGRHETKWEKFWLNTNSNLMAFQGEAGYIPILCLKSKQWICNLKMNGSFNYGCFAKDGSMFYSFGGDGHVYLWDIGTRKCVQKYSDEGCVNGTVLAYSESRNYLATGSSVGVVNIYDMNQAYAENNHNIINLKPMKTIMNLTTSITSAQFNPSGNMLLIASREKNSAVRMVNTFTQTVYSNWPTQQTNTGYVVSTDFSENGNWLSLGSSSGRCLLFRFK